MKKKLLTRGEWSLEQIFSWQNLLGVFVVMAIMVIVCTNDHREAEWYVIGAGIGFFIVAGWSMFWSMIAFSIVAGAIVAALPFLAPLAFILMIGLFIWRIKFIISNWRAVIAGFIVYGFCYTLVEKGLRPFDKILQVIAHIADPVAGFVSRLIGMNFGLLRVCIMTALIACLCACVFQLMMYFLYRSGYSSGSAFGIMGSIPLVIIALALPFLTVAALDGLFDAGHMGGDFMHDGAFAHDGAVHDAMAHDAYVRAPGYHHVSAYDRVAPDGHVEHVDGYLRSNPDGILENNLSYHGNGAHHAPMDTYAGGAHDAHVTIDVPYVGATYAPKRDVTDMITASMGRHLITSIILFFAGLSVLTAVWLYLYYGTIKPWIF